MNHRLGRDLKDNLSSAEFLLGLPCQQEQLLPRAKGGNPNLLQLLVSERGKGGQVDLVAHKDVRVPALIRVKRCARGNETN